MCKMLQKYMVFGNLTTKFKVYDENMQSLK